MGSPDHLTCLLWNMYAGQEAPVRTEHGTTECCSPWGCKESDATELMSVKQIKLIIKHSFKEKKKKILVPHVSVQHSRIAKM